ncbi:sensor histidine kinase [Parapedobacter sp. GCM10030251]|uniref:sensor histidine kinase n=1 Tax=Parapedobacter sp. GCM10030251 TaxID=3273419 RepID=UPI00361A7879
MGFTNFWLRLVCCIFPLLPQLILADETNYLTFHYTDEHGLPQNSIKGIAPDNLGFVWLITERGVVRFDGHERFKLPDSLSTRLKSERMTSLHTDSVPGALWAHTASNQWVYLYDGTARIVNQAAPPWRSHLSWQHPANDFSTGLPNRYPNLQIENLRVGDIRGAHYVIKQDSIIWYNSGVSAPSLRIPNPGKSFWQFVSLNDELYYIKDLHQALAIDTLGTVRPVRIVGDLADEYQKGKFSLFWNNAANQLFVQFNHNLYWLRPDKQGNLYSSRILSDFDIEANRIVVIYLDIAHQRLMLGSDSKGLFVLRRKHFSVVRAPETPPHDIYYTQLVLKDGSVLTDNGKRYDAAGRCRVIPAFSNMGRQYAHVYDANDRLWTLTEDTLFCHSALGDKLLQKVPNPEPGQALFRTQQHKLLLGSLQGGVFQWNQDAGTFTLLARLPSAISLIQQADLENIWIGTSQGLYRFHIGTKTAYPIKGLKQYHIRSLHQDETHPSRLWICTEQHGVFFHEDTSVYPMPMDEAGFLRSAHCILEDQRGYFWISTNKGLFRVKKQHLLDFRKPQATRLHYFHFGVDDGFATNEFNGGCNPCAIKLPNGMFSFPSLNGLVWFHPDSIRGEWPTGPLLVDGVNLDGTAIPAHDSIQLPSNFSRLNLTVSTPYASHLKNIRLEYAISTSTGKMQWLPLNPADHTLSINELSSGYHTVTFKMRQGWDVNDYHYHSITLYVTPRFYETAWFLLVLFILFIAIGWVILRLRTRFIVHQNEQLSRKVASHSAKLAQQHSLQQLLSASMVHDIRAPLNYVVQALKGISTQSQAEDGPLTQEIQLVYDSTQQIFRYSNNLSQLAKVMLDTHQIHFDAVSLHAIAQKQLKLFNPIALAAGTNLVNQISPGSAVHSNEEILSIILHNLLDNAIKFTKNGFVYVSAHADGDTQSLKVVDTGIGMSSSEMERYNNPENGRPKGLSGEKGGLGLILVWHMARLINGTMMIRSAIGHGTAITITFAPRRTW